MKKKLFITGISGFIGSYLAEKAYKEYDVSGLVRQHPQQNESINKLKGKVRLYEGSLNDYARLINIIVEEQPDYVAHLGAITPVSYSFGHPQEVIKTNLLGTVNLTEVLKQWCPNLKLFVLASSVETYGQQTELMEKNIPFDDKTPQKAGSPYAVAKIGAEHYVKYLYYAYKFPGVCLRQTNTYGRLENDYFVTEAFVTEMLRNKDVVNFGNPKPIRAFLHIEDLVNLYLTLFKCKNKEILGKSFTIGPPNGVTIEDLAEMIAKKLDWKGKINWYTREIRDGEIYYLNSSNDYVTKLTGWKPKITLDKGLDRTIQFWKSKLGKL
jgi:dTDP-glucose 4,6-dehydratase